MKVVVDRKTWLRGEGPYESALLRMRDQKQCCLGFMLEQAGVSRGALTAHSTPAELLMDNYVAVEDMPAQLIARNLTSKPTMDNSTFCENAMKLNDSTFMGEEDREANLIELFKDHGIELEFV